MSLISTFSLSHELYNYSVTLDVHQNFVPKFNGRYLTSNVNITLPGASGSVPIGSRYAKFKTRKGRKVTSLGVLFDFTGGAKGTSVQKVADMVKELWFAEAIKEEPDLFLLAGHMPVSKSDSLDKWPLIFDAIRALHPYTPIMILGGHTHIRDCTQYDGRSMALESGRYMETIGTLDVYDDLYPSSLYQLIPDRCSIAAKLDHKTEASQNPENIVFSRRYLDPNRVTYEYHTGVKDNKFDTTLGLWITSGLKALADKFGLNFVYGIAKRDYTTNQSPYPSEGSSLSLFVEKALPVALGINNTRNNIPNVIIANSGSQRFNIYTGPFTKNDQLTASFYPDQFLYIPEVRLSDARKVLAALNGGRAPPTRRGTDAAQTKADDLQYVDERYKAWLQDMDKRGGVERREAQNQTLGYVTSDSCPGVGDDIAHAPLPYYPLPKFVNSVFPDVAEDATIDVVFIDYIEARVVAFLNSIQKVKTYSSSDVGLYSPVLASDAFGLYAQAAWN
ncbi:hypothetical protein C0991_009414 [Blastosporella zonata]|nr:hypothetical protein C0991_009414 [Blastosporella zonata]